MEAWATAWEAWEVCMAGMVWGVWADTAWADMAWVVWADMAWADTVGWAAMGADMADPTEEVMEAGIMAEDLDMAATPHTLTAREAFTDITEAVTLPI